MCGLHSFLALQRHASPPWDDNNARLTDRDFKAISPQGQAQAHSALASQPHLQMGMRGHSVTLGAHMRPRSAGAHSMWLLMCYASSPCSKHVHDWVTLPLST